MKKCKPTAKTKGFESCGKDMTNEEYRQFGLCSSCLWEWMAETESGKIWKLKVFDPRVERRINKKRKIENQELKINLTNWRAKLQTKIQEISRLIDIGLPCLALGYHAGQIHGGHIYSKGSNITQSLNLHNIHRQSAQSNYSHNDDGLLREKLAEEYGEDYLSFVRSLKQTPSLQWSNLDYREFYKKACLICNDMKRAGRIFDLEGRIKARNEINETLGIYEKPQCIYEFKK